MTLELRAPVEGEIHDYLGLIGRTFGGTAASEETHRAERPTVELDRSIAIFDGDQIVATAASWGNPLTLPGAGPVPAAAISRVTVRSTHRRRGLLTRMMRHQLEDVHRRGEIVAALFASEAPIYGRFGYGVATYEGSVEIERARSAFRAPADPSGVREISRAELPAVGVELAARIALRYPGFVQRDRASWELEAADLTDFRFGAGELIAVVHDAGDGPDGLAAYRMRVADWNNPALQLNGLMAATDRAYAALWRHCLDVDLIKRVRAHGRLPMEPLRHMLVDFRAYDERLEDGMWLRLVDVPAALAGRRYRVAGSLSLRVEDSMCEWNAGEYALEAGLEGATCRVAPTSTPDLVMSAASLASIYLGTTPASTLAAAGLIEERTPGALARADDLFAWPVPGWCPLHF